MIPSFAILTDEPNKLVVPHHDRTPVVLAEPESWLDVETPLDAFKSVGAGSFRGLPVNPAVNKVSEKYIDAIELPV